MANYFDIPIKLPSFNEFRAETARNLYKGGKMKSEIEDSIIYCIMLAKNKGTLKPIKTYPIQLKCTWREKTSRMDIDNRRASVKFILDAMQKAQIIPNDNRKFVCGIFDEFIKSDNDGVTVEIIELPKNIKLIESES